MRLSRILVAVVMLIGCQTAMAQTDSAKHSAGEEVEEGSDDSGDGDTGDVGEEDVGDEDAGDDVGDATTAGESASDDEDDDDDASASADEKEKADLDASRYRWYTAAGRYADPTSFFSLHGYINGVFADYSQDWTAPDPTKLGPPGNVHVPNTPFASFQYDAALIIGSNLGDITSLLLELHFIPEPSGVGKAGPGGLAIGIPEAAVTIAVVPDYLNVSGGIYMAPFANVNHDYLLAQNLFTTLPKGLGAFPIHYNERGVRLDGAAELAPGFGLDYVLSVGNGLQQMDVRGQFSHDKNQDMTYQGRLGVYPGLGEKLEVAYSYCTGQLRSGAEADMTLPPDSPLHYESRFSAHGVDAIGFFGGLRVRGFLIASTEELSPVFAGDPDPPDINRFGYMAEADYRLIFSKPLWLLESIGPKVRYDFIRTAVLGGGGTQAAEMEGSVVSVGMNLYPVGSPVSFSTYPYVNYYLSLEYHVQNELGSRTELENDRFIFRVTGRF